MLAKQHQLITSILYCLWRDYSNFLANVENMITGRYIMQIFQLVEAEASGMSRCGSAAQQSPKRAAECLELIGNVEPNWR